MLYLRIGLSLLGVALAAMAESDFQPLPDLPLELQDTNPPPAGAVLHHAETLDLETARPNATLRVDGLPEVSYFEKRWTMASGKVGAVRWSAQVARRSRGSMPARLAPEMQAWSDGFALPGAQAGRYFPGYVLRVVPEKGALRVQYFPHQVDRITGQRLELVRAELQFYESPAATSIASAPQSLIVTTKALLEGARLLRDFHAKHGIDSEILFLESLAHHSEIAESALPAGYKDDSRADLEIVRFDAATGSGYDYSTARRLQAYLHPLLGKGLEYVTLLGDSTIVPPSYYFTVPQGFDVRWGVTDMCYVALRKCREPHAAVGRLPFHKLEEVRNHLAKSEAWLAQAASRPSELRLMGGMGLSGPLYIGELGTLRTLGHAADWRGVTKAFRTKGNYDRAAVLDTLAGATDTSFVYSLDHGRGNQWMIEKEWVGSKEIEELSASSQSPPVIFSIACRNASTDSELLVESLFDSEEWGANSVGEALLLSSAGAVAYIGSARPAMGAPIFQFDESGNLDVLDSNYAMKILDSAIEDYRVAGKGRLGDFLRASLVRYAGDPAADFATDRHRWAFFHTTLLGDPTLPLPERVQKEKAHGLARAVGVIERAFVGLFPVWKLPFQGGIELQLESAVPTRVTAFEQQMQAGRVTERAMGARDLASGHDRLEIANPMDRRVYFLRVENTQGVPLERQVWFQTR